MYISHQRVLPQTPRSKAEKYPETTLRPYQGLVVYTTMGVKYSSSNSNFLSDCLPMAWKLVFVHIQIYNKNKTNIHQMEEKKGLTNIALAMLTSGDSARKAEPHC